MGMASNDILTLFGSRTVKVIRTIILEGPADVVWRQLDTHRNYLQEDCQVFGHGLGTMTELPRHVTLVLAAKVCQTNLCVTPEFAEMDRFADEGNPNHD